MRVWRVIVLLLCSMTILPSGLQAEKGQSGLSLGLGEALLPSQLRLTINDIDVMISSHAGLSLGQRLWSGSSYVGFGIGSGLSTQAGFYGLIGAEYAFFSVFAVGFEFSGFGGLGGGKSKGIITWGVLW